MAGTDDEDFEILEPLPDDENNGRQPVADGMAEDGPELVACTGMDLERLPPDFVTTHSQVARRVDLSYNRLSSLDGLSKFSCLEELVLDNNQLTDESIQKLPSLPHLHTLTLNKNMISDIDGLLARLSKSCPCLRYLSLLFNQACPNEILGQEYDDDDYQRYRYYVLYKLPSLTFLDSRQATSQEKSDARKKGQFTRVVKPEAAMFEEPASRSRSDYASAYTPLPQSVPVTGQHRAVFGQCKYVYYGKHSEGNRFIRNNQL